MYKAHQIPSPKLTAKAPEKWMVVSDDPLLLGPSAYFQGPAASLREGNKFQGFVWGGHLTFETHVTMTMII